MIQNKFGELIFSELDVINQLMQGAELDQLNSMIVDATVDLDCIPDIVDPIPNLSKQQIHNCSVPEFHALQQNNWHMPEKYKTLDIAQHVLSLCSTQEQLQRCGEELLLYQEKDLFNLLRYLKYLVDIMQHNQIIWGVGRGSSVASYVLYKLGVHRIDSMYYNLNIKEFLR